MTVELNLTNGLTATINLEKLDEVKDISMDFLILLNRPVELSKRIGQNYMVNLEGELRDS